MKRYTFILFALLINISLLAQTANKLKAAMKSFNSDVQLKYALASLYVVNEKTGEVVFNQNSRVGMATASTAKIVTAATAMELMGSDYKYETKFGIVKTPNGNSLYIEPSGDPTLGSWRWEETKETFFLNRLKEAVAATGITRFESVIIHVKNRGTETIPDGWIWQDLGNYYGASAQAVNWRENQFDLFLKSGNKIGDAVSVVKTEPFLYDYQFTCEATAASKESGDNSYLYYPSMGKNNGLITGTIPLGQSNFKVSGSIYDPVNQFAKTIMNHLKGVADFSTDKIIITALDADKVDWFFTNTSPSLSKIVYWFLRKSINLYGEALLKSIALQQKKTATTEDGVNAIQQFWKTKGIDPEAFHLYDGSGLSPQNRITTHAQVEVLRYAKKQPWFKDYFEGFPLYNEMKMKSGTINRVKGFSGYQRSKDGNDYVFSFLVNNYSGSEYALIRKIFRVLDTLK